MNSKAGQLTSPIGEVEDYYGVHEIVAFNVRPVSSGNEVTHHFLEVAYLFEKTLEYAEDEMLRAVFLKKLICKSLNLCIIFLCSLFVFTCFLFSFFTRQILN